MRILTVAALAATIAAAGPPALAEDYYGHQKVVYHVDYPGGDHSKAYTMVLANMQNHINAVGRDNIDLKVVLHGDGVDLLRVARDDMTLQSKVIALKEQKVRFLVCNNTLTGRHIDPNRDLFDVDREDIVPSGVAELSRLQMMGYTYLRP
jgi:intracellular sulfur oxidation DsrE/DsrF family protein